MQHFCTGVLAGCLLSLFLPLLPAFFQFIFITGLLLCWRYRLAVFSGVLAFLLSWHWQVQQYWHAQQQLLAYPQPYYEVTILSYQAQGAEQHRLRLRLEQGVASGYSITVRWRQAPNLQIGQQWRLALILSPLQSSMNPGRRPQAMQGMLDGVIAQGYVLPEQPTILRAEQQWLRSKLLEQVAHFTEATQSAPILQALTVGERQFTPELWQGVKHSGLGHVLTISGLHIGLVFAWGMLLAKALTKPFQLNQPLYWQLCLAFIPALTYAYLAGFAIPTLRAALALLLFALSQLFLRPLNRQRAWLLAVSVMLLVNPFWVLSVSFWLSVLAVGSILLLIWCLAPPTAGWLAKLRYYLVFQLALTALMSLVSMAFFGGISLLALLSNVLFIPWCSLLAIPLLLFTLCWSLLGLPFASLAWQLTDSVFLPLWYWLKFSATLPVWWSVPHLPLVAALLVALLLLLSLIVKLPRLPALLPVLITSLVLLLPERRTAQLWLFDSGQRTVLLGQHNRVNWLYLDAPPEQLEGLIRYFVLEQLRYLRLRTLDYLVIPALDREMAPALLLLKQYYPKLKVFAARPTLPNTASCAALAAIPEAGFQHWPLTPTDPCVLSVNMAGWQLLLPGHLQLNSEQQLLLQYPTLDADFYLLADYGRATANSLPFLQALAPVQLLIAATAHGPHRYPLQAVQKRITLLGLPLYHSGEQGAIHLSFTAEKVSVRTTKQQKHATWYEKPLAIAETSRSTR